MEVILVDEPAVKDAHESVINAGSSQAEHLPANHPPISRFTQHCISVGTSYNQVSQVLSFKISKKSQIKPQYI
jgi:hypothetical protein